MDLRGDPRRGPRRRNVDAHVERKDAAYDARAVRAADGTDQVTGQGAGGRDRESAGGDESGSRLRGARDRLDDAQVGLALRSEEHTSELQSQFHLVCRLLLEKKKT